MRTAPTNKKIRELITMVKDGRLIPRPDFQRRLVWSREDKNLFIDSILKGYPFPEIYVADGSVDLNTADGSQLLVDGLQRVTTLIQYFDADPELKLTTVPQYSQLLEDEKKAYLQYDVAVRDLGSVDREELIEVFKRINATKYSLLDIEVNNAVYAGALKKFAARLAESEFFYNHNVFSAADLKRMGDLRYTLGLIITMITGYTNRDDAFGEYLELYNDDFPLESEIKDRIDTVFQFLDECGFERRSRVWRKADLFTVMIEIDHALLSGSTIDPFNVVQALESFYASIETETVETSSVSGIYYKAALQASNDRLNRARRGYIIGAKIHGVEDDAILDGLKAEGLT